jgi:hypothetical protein
LAVPGRCDGHRPKQTVVQIWKAVRYEGALWMDRALKLPPIGKMAKILYRKIK